MLVPQERKESMVYHGAVVSRSYAELIPVNFGYEDCAPGHSYGPAVREFWLLHYVVSGFGVFQREGVTYHLSPGQMFVVPPGLVTYYQAEADKPWNYVWIAFTCAGDPPVELDSVITCPEAGEIFERIKGCQHLDGGTDAFLRGYLWELFGVLLEQRKQLTDYIDLALGYMHNEYGNGITVGDVVAKVGLDRSYFSTSFKKRVGVSPQNYLMNLRMEKAAALLRRGGEKPSVAAASVGYQDLFVFSKAFKRHFGICPREYMKMNR